MSEVLAERVCVSLAHFLAQLVDALLDNTFIVVLLGRLEAVADEASALGEVVKSTANEVRLKPLVKGSGAKDVWRRSGWRGKHAGGSFRSEPFGSENAAVQLVQQILSRFVSGTAGREQTIALEQMEDLALTTRAPPQLTPLKTRFATRPVAGFFLA
jgi:hypothetical protein